MKKIIIITIILILIGLVNASNYVPGNAGHANLWTNTVQAKDGSTVTIQDSLNITENLCIGGKCFTSLGEGGIGGCDSHLSPMISRESDNPGITELGTWNVCSLVGVGDERNIFSGDSSCIVYKENDIWKIKNFEGFNCSAQCYNINCLIDPSDLEIDIEGLNLGGSGGSGGDLEVITVASTPVTGYNGDVRTTSVFCPESHPIRVACTSGDSYGASNTDAWPIDPNGCTGKMYYSCGLCSSQIHAICAKGGSGGSGGGNCYNTASNADVATDVSTKTATINLANYGFEEGQPVNFIASAHDHNMDGVYGNSEDATYCGYTNSGLVYTVTCWASGLGDTGQIWRSSFDWLAIQKKSVCEEINQFWQQNGDEIYYDIGNVGIGVSDPNATLDIGKGVLRAQTHIGYSGLHLMTSEAVPINFTTNSAQRMIIDESGNVGIGTTTPISKLHVNSTTGNAITANAGANSAVQGYGSTGVEGYGTSVGVIGELIGEGLGAGASAYLGYEEAGKGYGLFSNSAVRGSELCIDDDCRTAWPVGGSGTLTCEYQYGAEAAFGYGIVGSTGASCRPGYAIYLPSSGFAYRAAAGGYPNFVCGMYGGTGVPFLQQSTAYNGNSISANAWVAAGWGGYCIQAFAYCCRY